VSDGVQARIGHEVLADSALFSNLTTNSVSQGARTFRCHSCHPRAGTAAEKLMRGVEVPGVPGGFREYVQHDPSQVHRLSRRGPARGIPSAGRGSRKASSGVVAMRWLRSRAISSRLRPKMSVAPTSGLTGHLGSSPAGNSTGSRQRRRDNCDTLTFCTKPATGASDLSALVVNRVDGGDLRGCG
jgi:hypothetical protein